MKITRTVDLTGIVPRGTQHVHYDLVRRMTKLSKSLHSGGYVHFSMGPFSVKNGIIEEKDRVSHQHPSRLHAVGHLTFRLFGDSDPGTPMRVDIFRDGTHEIFPNFDFELDDNDRQVISICVDEWIRANREHVEKTNKWCSERPWDNIQVGMTLGEAIKVLTDLGW